MAAIFNESTIAAEPGETGMARQRLLTEERVAGTHILLDRLPLAPGGAAGLKVPMHALGWF
ncbi:MAG TPA: hypothetical protein VGF53_08660 [Pseudolabrys sp.]|jgi:hypothetical protein